IDPRNSGMRPITGRSLRPIFESDRQGQVQPERDHVLVGKERTDVGRPQNGGYPIRGMITRDFLYLRNDEPSRWPAGNPETGYLDTDGSPSKTLILQLGRTDRSDPFWRLNFGMRPTEELYRLSDDPDCVRNVASNSALNSLKSRLRDRMDAILTSQNDPRMLGEGHVFDGYEPTNGSGFYERYMNAQRPDDRPRANWVNPTDFEVSPLSSVSTE
ncbi:MAG: heparan N-sulfatase, partial [Planctomycetota bacterium]